MKVEVRAVGWPKLQEQLVKYFGGRFEDLFETVLVNPETGEERTLVARNQ